MDLVEDLVKKGCTVTFHKDGNMYVTIISKKEGHIKLDFIGMDTDFRISFAKADEKLLKYEEKK